MKERYEVIMGENQKSVFISYRRSISKYIARLIFDALQARGYSVFIDIESIDSGKFDRIILNQIAARAHFILILSPSSLDRVADPNDWLRREIEYAIQLNRNIVPILVDGFSFDEVKEKLPESLVSLPRFNGLLIHYDYFDEGISRLCKRFLKKPMYGRIVPVPKEEQVLVDEKIRKATLEKMPYPPKSKVARETSSKKTSKSIWVIAGIFFLGSRDLFNFIRYGFSKLVA